MNHQPGPTIEARRRKSGAPLAPWQQQRSREPHDAPPWRPAPRRDPTWLENQVGMRLPRPRPGELGAPVSLGPLGQIRARRGYQAVAQEIEKDQWIVSFVPVAVTKGVGGGIVDLALKAIVSAVSAIAKAVKNRDGGSEGDKESNAGKGKDEVGCDGKPCACASAVRGGWY